jgi:hypothetical protein
MIVSCGLCNGDGEVCNPGNADPTRGLEDWLPPVPCPRCRCTGIDPMPERRLSVVRTDDEPITVRRLP